MSEHVFNVGDHVVIKSSGIASSSYRSTKIARETSTRWYTTDGLWFSKANCRGQRPAGPYSVPEMLPADDPQAVRFLGLIRLSTATDRLNRLVRDQRPHNIDLPAIRATADAVMTTLRDFEEAQVES